MSRFTSGILNGNDGSREFLVNSEYYTVRDDATCFELSCMYHNLPTNSKIKDCKIVFCDVKFKENSSSFTVEFLDKKKRGCCECRLYKIAL